MKKRALLIFVLLGLCVGCSTDLEDKVTTGSLTGVVADETTGEMIPTVRLELTPGGSSAVTGSDGSFTFNNLEAGDYTISLTKKGYKSTQSAVTVRADNVTEAHLLIERIPAVITIDREVLDFGDNMSMNTLSFNMVNNNYVDLDYDIIENCGWIESVDPETGTLPYGKTGTVVVKINREALLVGVNETAIVVSTSDGSSELTVRATGLAKDKATLNTLDATEVKASSARLNGEIISAGHPAYTERGFVYGLSPMPDHQNSIEVMTALVTDDVQFSVALTGLELGKTYYARAYAINEIGTAYSTNQTSFTTKALLPQVAILRSNVNTTSMHASIFAEITSSGDPAYTECGVVYSTANSNPTIYDTKVKATADAYGKFEVHQLPCPMFDTDYYYRAFATNEAGTAYSETAKVYVKSSLPQVKTLAITDESKEYNSAVLHGEIVSAGLPAYTERGFVYSDTYESPTIYDSKFIVSGSGVGTFEYRVSLTSDKAYYVRAYAKSSKGVVYGDVVKLFPNYYELKAAGIAVQPNDITKGKRVAWSDADSMCENSTYEGFTDWRLPTLDELRSMYEDQDAIGGFIGSYYFSSTTGYDYYSRLGYYYVDFWDGKTYMTSVGFNCYARCVRSIKSSED